MLDPYMRMRKVRDARTIGSTEYANKIYEENEKTANKLEESMNDAYQQVNKIKAEIREEAVVKKDTIINAATKEVG